MKDEGVTEESAVSKYYDEIFTYYDICDAVLERLALSRRAAPGDRESVKRWLKDYSMSYDMIMLAADRARDASGQKMAYMESILHTWYERDLLTPDDVRRADNQRRVSPISAGAPQSQSRPTAATGYAQHTYAPGELNRVYTDIMNEEGD